MTPIITVENVSKRYVRTEHRPSLRHEAMNMFRRWLSRASGLHAQEFFALQGVSFTVNAGEGVGIIGRNGSGKTTLLRILSGIAQPTTGKVSVQGRFAALIGLSAGFLQEMSGRKNIYLNAAMHGMHPREIEAIVDPIIDFAEIRPFIDTPVKHYSSGMSARLGFSVAIHILPDIVFLDEVLAVGDTAFQNKCQERLRMLKDEGRTFLVVSHSPSDLIPLCPRTIWLDSGRVVVDGPTEEVAARYAEAMQSHASLPANSAD